MGLKKKRIFEMRGQKCSADVHDQDRSQKGSVLMRDKKGCSLIACKKNRKFP